jgi:DnaJ-domain-containing protein 1
MPYVILGIALLIGFMLLARAFVTADVHTLARTLKISGLALGGAFVVYLAATRQIEWLFSAAAVALPFLVRWRRMSQPPQGWRWTGGSGTAQRSAGQSSTVETRFIRMSLDHDSSTIDGLVIDGGFAGRKLSELQLPDLLALLRECRLADEQSANVLEAYLDRAHKDWREAGDGSTDGAAGQQRSRTWGRGPAGSSALTPEDAYKVLGLQPGATREEIKEAHRRLMRANHPDMGGSDYLASRINEAKDLLLGE